MLAFKPVGSHKHLFSVSSPGAKVLYFLSPLHSLTAARAWWDNAFQAVIKWWKGQRPGFICLALCSPESGRWIRSGRALWLGDGRRRIVCPTSPSSNYHKPCNHDRRLLDWGRLWFDVKAGSKNLMLFCFVFMEPCSIAFWFGLIRGKLIWKLLCFNW